MIKKWFFYTSLTIIIAFLSSGFKPFDLDSNHWFLINDTITTKYLFPSREQSDSAKVNILFTKKVPFMEEKVSSTKKVSFLGKLFHDYKEAIGFKESQGKYNKVNTLGYMGKYQFGKETLKTVGIRDTAQFMNNPKMQEKAFVALLSQNKAQLKEVIKEYDGQVVGGVKVTESGILAAAHLGGVGSVKKFFKTNGNQQFKDAYGTSLRSYMKKFGGYETSEIVANSKARVR